MKKQSVLFFIILVTSFFGGSVGYANDMNYSVQAKIPENQVNKQLTYFDIHVAPNQQQELKVTVANNSKEKATIQLNANNALTNSNGVIEYTKHGVKPDASLKYPLEKLIKNPKQKVTLAPGESKEVAFDLQMPKEAIKGTILGGIHVQKEDDSKAKDNKKNVTIENVYSYIIGVQIREELTAVTPKLFLREVKPTLINYRTAVSANLQNATPTHLRKVSIDAAIRKQNSQKILHQVKKEQMSIAPNTNFNFPISWENQVIQPGKYILTMHVTSDQGQWDFTKEFTVKAKDVKKVNDEAVEVKKEDHTLLYILSGVIVVLLFGFIWFYLKTRKKETDA
ncbi:DUF916 and DUF3324 domain-containing protein [Enterococcus faecalis]